METTQLIFTISAAVCALLSAVLAVRLLTGMRMQRRGLDELSDTLAEALRQAARENAQTGMEATRALGETYMAAIERGQTAQNARIGELSEQYRRESAALHTALAEELSRFDGRFSAFAMQNQKASAQLRESVEGRMAAMQEENRRALDEIRGTVDEKLQKTLEERINRSFAVVSERLEQVYKGLGEMQTLASGVGDLKKVLANVKTRGILGEIQLGAILEEILSPEQYETNVVTRKNSAKPVEYAVRLPGSDGGTVYLPIDSKFPADAYEKLRDAYDAGIPEQIAAEKKHLESVIKLFAKDIRDKYLDPPVTTEFGIMFLPFEGLYAEVVNLGLVEVLAREYKVSIAGPTTMAALLNSLQMGFRTLAIQKRSSEVWKVLGAVRTEFDRFGDVLEATQKRLEQTSSELDKLVGVRTRQIRSKLRTVTSLPQDEAAMLLNGESTDEQD